MEERRRKGVLFGNILHASRFFSAGERVRHRAQFALLYRPWFSGHWRLSGSMDRLISGGRNPVRKEICAFFPVRSSCLPAIDHSARDIPLKFSSWIFFRGALGLKSFLSPDFGGNLVGVKLSLSNSKKFG